MSGTSALPSSPQGAIASHHAQLMLVVTASVGILRFHPSFLPFLVSVYWADALILAMGALWLTYTGGIRWTPLVEAIATFGLIFLTFVTTAILGSSLFNAGPLPWSANLIQAARFLTYGCIWIFLADTAVRAQIDWERTARVLVIVAVAGNVGLSIVQLVNPPGLGQAVYALWGEHKLRPLGATTPRVYGTFFNANWFGVFAAWCATYAVASWRSDVARKLPYAVMTSVLFMLLVSGSRTGVLTTALGVIVTLFSLGSLRLPRPTRTSSSARLRAILVAIVSVAIVAFAVRRLPLQSLIRRFVELQVLLDAADGSGVESFRARVRTWEKAYDIFLEYPLFGVGGNTETWGFNAHSGYLAMLMFFGIVGAAGLTMLVVGACTLVWHSLDNDDSGRRLRAWFYGFTGALALAMTVDEIVFTSQLLFLWFILLALAMGQSALRRERLV